MMYVIRLLLVVLAFCCSLSFANGSEDISDLLGSFSKNQVPDLSRKDQRNAFSVYLTQSFGGNTSDITDARLQTLDNYLNSHSELTKRAIAPVIIQSVIVDYESTEESSKFLSQLRSGLGRAKSVFLQPDANRGDWSKIKHNGKSIFTKEQLDQLFNEAFLSEIREEELSSEKLISAYMREFKKINIGTEATRQILQRLTLIATTQDIGDWSKKIKSKNVMLALSTAKDILEKQEALYAWATDGRSLDDDIDKSNLFFKIAVRPHSENMNTLNRITAKVKENEISTVLSETIIRALSIAEAPFRSCLANDCATSTYFSKALDPNFLYFTETDEQGNSKGHITVVLGSATNKSKEQVKVAFVDKIQGVDNTNLELMLEATRRTLAAEGYELAIPVNFGFINGISNDLATRTYLAKEYNPYIDQTVVYKKFKPEEHNYDFSNRFSRADKELKVKPVLPIEIGGNQQVTLGEKIEASEKKQVNLWDAIEASFLLKDSNLNDQIKYIDIMEKLLLAGMPIDPKFNEYLDKWVRDESNSIKLRYRVMTFYLENEPMNMDPLVDKFTQGQLKNLLQNWSQIKRISWASDAYFWRWIYAINFSVNDVRRLKIDLHMSDSLWNSLLKDVPKEEISNTYSELQNNKFFGIRKTEYQSQLMSIFVLTDFYKVLQKNLEEGSSLNMTQKQVIQNNIKKLEGAIQDQLDKILGNISFVGSSQIVNLIDFMSNYVKTSQTHKDDLLFMRFLKQKITSLRIKKSLKHTQSIAITASLAVSAYFFITFSPGEYFPNLPGGVIGGMEGLAFLSFCATMSSALIYGVLRLPGFDDSEKMTKIKEKIKRAKVIYKALKKEAKEKARKEKDKGGFINSCKSLFRAS